MRTQVLDWNAFMSGKVFPKLETPSLLLAVAVGTVTVLKTSLAQAAMSDKIIHAFDPLIGVIQSLSYPVCFIAMAGGMLLITVGQRHRGISMIKWAAIGYIGMQLVPGIMGIVGDVGRSMK